MDLDPPPAPIEARAQAPDALKGGSTLKLGGHPSALDLFRSVHSAFFVLRPDVAALAETILFYDLRVRQFQRG